MPEYTLAVLDRRSREITSVYTYMPSLRLYVQRESATAKNGTPITLGTYALLAYHKLLPPLGVDRADPHSMLFLSPRQPT